jgi:hypothetical protein
MFISQTHAEQTDSFHSRRPERQLLPENTHSVLQTNNGLSFPRVRTRPVAGKTKSVKPAHSEGANERQSNASLIIGYDKRLHATSSLTWRYN